MIRFLYVFLTLIPWIFVGMMYLVHYATYTTNTVVHPDRMTIEHPQMRANNMKPNRQKREKEEPVPTRRVFVDWPLHSDDLSYMNYKSFESLLAITYTPQTMIEIIVISQNTAHHYKIKGILR
jgi:hypothetical protein